MKQLLLALSLLAAPWVHAQQEATARPDTVAAQPEKVNQFSIDADFFTRGEVRKGGLPQDNEGNTESKAVFIMARTRLGVSYQRPHIEARINAQHNGVWGQAGKGSFNLNEAWVRLTARVGLFAQVGRQVLSYDDERIIGSDDWAMASMAHDMLRLGYEGHSHKVHAMLAYNQNSDATNGNSYYVNGAQPYKTMQNLWYHYDFARVPLGVSALFMNIGMQGGDSEANAFTSYQQMLGAYVKFAPAKWTAEAAYYHQMGRNENKTPIDAWMMSLKASFSPVTMFTVSTGYDHMSGDSRFAVPPPGGIGLTQHKTIRGFSTVYGSHHQFYGAMDFFYVRTYVGGFTPGLQNFFVSGKVTPVSGLTLNAAYHLYATATRHEDWSKVLGHELSLQAGYKPLKWINISAGFSYMKGTRTMELLKRSSDSRNLLWGWLSLRVNPIIFTTKW